MSMCFKKTVVTCRKEVFPLVSGVCSHGLIRTSLSTEETLSILCFSASLQYAANRLSVSSDEMNRKLYVGVGSLTHVLPKITGSILSQSQTQILVDNLFRKPV